MSKEFDIAPDLGAQLFPEETAEEAVARIVAQNPQKHGVTVQERMARARAAVTRMLAAGADLSNLSAEDALIVAIGGDPYEMMTGNKPRYTVDEAGNVKDHETGEVHRGRDAGIPEILPGDSVVEGASEETQGDGAGVPAATRIQHDSVEDIGPDPAAASEHAIDFLADKIDEVTAQALRGEFDANTKAITLDDIDRIKTEGPEAVLGPPDVVLPGTCAHFWPEDPDEETRCGACGLTFKAWVES